MVRQRNVHSIARRIHAVVGGDIDLPRIRSPWRRVRYAPAEVVVVVPLQAASTTSSTDRADTRRNSVLMACPPSAKAE